jgi:cytidylate kinase
MYRAIALDALENDLTDPDEIAARARQITLGFDWAQRPARVLLNGRDVSDAIRQPRVTENTYTAADNPWVREILVEQQRRIGLEAGSLVTEGRDQGTIVFPHAAFKFYLDAEPQERARRRIAQLEAKGLSFRAAEILDQIVARDQRDASRPVGPLARPADALVLDTTNMTLLQVVDTMEQIVRNATPAPRAGDAP